MLKYTRQRNVHNHRHSSLSGDNAQSRVRRHMGWIYAAAAAVARKQASQAFAAQSGLHVQV